MAKLDMTKLAAVQASFDKTAFVPMPGGESGGAPPVAGGGPMTEGQGAPMGGDPAAGGMPMDPAAGGMPPMDPAAMGGMPPMDPMAMMGGGEPPAGSVTMSMPELLELIAILTGSAAPAPAEGELAAEPAAEVKPKKSGKADVAAKLDEILQAVQGGGGAMGGMPPPMDPAAMGGMPPMDPSMGGGMPPMG